MEFSSLLTALGLNENEASVYQHLLTHGKQKASDIATALNIGRGNTYNILTNLASLKLILVDDGTQQIFQVAEPGKLRTLLEIERMRVEQLQSSLNTTLPHLLSAYNLTTGKPAIETFEGIEGVEQALAESLAQKEEILTFADPFAFSEEIRDLNERYVKKRLREKITKRVLLPDNQIAKKYQEVAPKEYSTYKIIKNFPPLPGVAIEIFGDTVSMLNLGNGKTIAVTMRDKAFAEFYRRLFFFLWDLDAVQKPPVL
jgi:sugar-specific transcriptional regulator TrmB